MNIEQGILKREGNILYGTMMDAACNSRIVTLYKE
jgi:hypothetical protein